MLAYDFPLLSMFWVLLMWYVMFSIFFAIIWAFIDNFRRSDHSGWAKAGWAFLIIILPFIGMLIYIVARPAQVAAVT
jgi:ABC-type multidrug transport system permease subunit